MSDLKKFKYAERGILDGRIAYPDDEYDTKGNLVFDGIDLWSGTRVEDGTVTGEYHGTLILEDYVPIARYKTSLTTYGLMNLLGMPYYAAILVGISAGDPIAAYFIEVAKQLGAVGKFVEVGHPDYIATMGSFLSSGYIDQAKHDEMLLGVLI